VYFIAYDFKHNVLFISIALLNACKASSNYPFFKYFNAGDFIIIFNYFYNNDYSIKREF